LHRIIEAAYTAFFVATKAHRIIRRETASQIFNTETQIYAASQLVLPLRRREAKESIMELVYKFKIPFFVGMKKPSGRNRREQLKNISI